MEHFNSFVDVKKGTTCLDDAPFGHCVIVLEMIEYFTCTILAITYLSTILRLKLQTQVRGNVNQFLWILLLIANICCTKV